VTPFVLWNRARGFRSAIVVALLGVGFLSIVPPAEAATSGVKTVAASVSPANVAAGADAVFSFTLTNEAAVQSLGSANVTLPTGFVLNSIAPAAAGSIVGGIVELRNLGLAPGASVTISVDATAPCAATPPPPPSWVVVAKQANNFNGPPGNDFTLDPASSISTSVSGSCQLAFFAQPAEAVVNTSISSVPFVSGGGAVEVQVLDGNKNPIPSSTAPITLMLSPSSPNAPAGAVLSGGGATNASGGIASFTTLSINLHGVYVLSATSPGITSAPSNSFGIWDSDGGCGALQPCNASSSVKNVMNTQIQGVAGPGGFLSISLGEDRLSCNGNFNHAPSFTTFSEVNYSPPPPQPQQVTVTLTIFKSELKNYPNSGLSFWAICYGSSKVFTTSSGTPAPLVNGLYTGLLPNCTTAQGPPPCVESIGKDPANDIVETVSVPLGDPIMG
jgi:hypothetical protein